MPQSSATERIDRSIAASQDPTSRRWIPLIFVALAQLLIALDATIMNVALPSVQAALEFSDADRQWVITAYTLAFGALLATAGLLALVAACTQAAARDGLRRW
jgi:MFS family permease